MRPLQDRVKLRQLAEKERKEARERAQKALEEEEADRLKNPNAAGCASPVFCNLLLPTHACASAPPQRPQRRLDAFLTQSSLHSVFTPHRTAPGESAESARAFMRSNVKRIAGRKAGEEEKEEEEPAAASDKAGGQPLDPAAEEERKRKIRARTRSKLTTSLKLRKDERRAAAPSPPALSFAFPPSLIRARRPSAAANLLPPLRCRPAAAPLPHGAHAPRS